MTEDHPYDLYSGVVDLENIRMVFVVAALMKLNVIAGDIALADEGSARILTEQLALTAAAAEMRRIMPTELADAFAESRLGRPWRNTYGMMDSRYDARDIIDYVCL